MFRAPTQFAVTRKGKQRAPMFQKGMSPEKYANRPKCLIYTDGSRSDAERGIGGVLLGGHLCTSFFAVASSRPDVPSLLM